MPNWQSFCFTMIVDARRVLFSLNEVIGHMLKSWPRLCASTAFTINSNINGSLGNSEWRANRTAVTVSRLNMRLKCSGHSRWQPLPRRQHVVFLHQHISAINASIVVISVIEAAEWSVLLRLTEISCHLLREHLDWATSASAAVSVAALAFSALIW